MNRRIPLIALLTALVVGSSADAAPVPSLPGVRLQALWPEKTFPSPVGVVSPGSGSRALFILDKSGVMYRTALGDGTAASAPTPFLDLSARVFTKGHAGLIGAAFHPAFAGNGRFFVAYVRRASTFEFVVSEFRAAGGVVDPASESQLLVLPKKTPNHQGGCLAFGPDGKLYIGTGDAQDEANTSQNLASLFGKILRIDVDEHDTGHLYSIPRDNPFAPDLPRARGEIFALGFRNPWRFSFDAAGTLWVGDVGDQRAEWITKVRAGENHGWPYFEGTLSNVALPPGTPPNEFTPPYFQYTKDGPNDGTAMIGGYLYRGRQVPALQGRYVFGDWGRGAVYAILATGERGADMRLVGQVPVVSSLGEDADGELYACSLEKGTVYRLLPGS